MAVLALVLYGVWAVVGVGVRTLVQLRRTGDTGFRGLRGRPGSVEWCAGVLFVMAIAAGVAAPLADLSGVLVPVGPLTGFELGGAVLALVGMGVTLGAQFAMGDEWRIGVDPAERTRLLVGGPFALVRNPIFTAMALTATGLTLMVPNAVAGAGLTALIGALELQVRFVEEPHLLAAHGHATGPALNGPRRRP